MINSTTNKGRLIAAALRLAEKRSWHEVTLAGIAEEAGLSLADLRAEASSKADILGALMKAIDAEVLAPTRVPDTSQNARDRLFEVIMARFDALQPYKNALASIARSPTANPQLLARFLSSQRWMLEAAGISADGLNGTIRTAGLATLYSSTFRVWLADDDPGLSRTMAALDRRLRRGESAISFLDGVCSTLRRVTTPSPRRSSGPAVQPESPAPAAGPIVP